MNFLAHLYLAEKTPESLIGSLAADFLSPGDEDVLTPAVRAAIREHRAVDKFTDGHHIFRRSRLRLDNRYRHLKGILVDVFYDHFLAIAWDRYSEESLEGFATRVYAVLSESRGISTPGMQRMLPFMISQNWLVSYREVTGVSSALKRMERRLSRPTVLGEGAEQLVEHYEALRGDFDAFFPELQGYVDDLRLGQRE